MPTILIPVDGSDNALRAVQFAVTHVVDPQRTRIHLLNVQPAIVSGNARMYLNKETIDGYHWDQGDQTLRWAAQLLERTNVRFTTYMEVGHPPERIAQFAREHGCEEIVMGTRGLGPIKGLLLGSVAMQVLHLVDVPVTLVK